MQQKQRHILKMSTNFAFIGPKLFDNFFIPVTHYFSLYLNTHNVVCAVAKGLFLRLAAAAEGYAVSCFYRLTI
jgi:hypothetical protein